MSCPMVCKIFFAPNLSLFHKSGGEKVEKKAITKRFAFKQTQ